MTDGIDSAAVTGGSTLFDLQHRMKDVKLSNIQQRMKDNAVKIAEDVKTGELQQRMKMNATKITGDVVTAYETIKESETLHSMIKESTLDKLLVGRGTLDIVLAEEVEEWNVVENDDDKENTTTSNVVHESYMQKSSSYLKALSRSGGNVIVSIGSSPAIADAFVDVNAHLTQYFNAEKLGQLGDLASEAGGAVLEMVKDPLARNVDVPIAKQHLAKQTGGEWTMASNRAGWTQPVDSGSVESSANGADEGTSVVKKLVLTLCGPGGEIAEPSTDKLEEFILILPTLKHDEVCLALLDTLEDGNPWLMKAKALCVIETVILLEAEAVLEGGGGDDAPYFDFLRKCTGPVERLANHPRDSVRGPARRVLEALGHIVVEETSPRLDEPEVHDVVTTAVSSSPSQQQEVALSMFSGFNTKAASQMQQMQKAYQESKKKMQVQATKDLQVLKQLEVPSLSSWKPPIPTSKSTKQQKLILDAL